MESKTKQALDSNRILNWYLNGKKNKQLPVAFKKQKKHKKSHLFKDFDIDQFSNFKNICKCPGGITIFNEKYNKDEIANTGALVQLHLAYISKATPKTITLDSTKLGTLIYKKLHTFYEKKYNFKALKSEIKKGSKLADAGISLVILGIALLVLSSALGGLTLLVALAFILDGAVRHIRSSNKKLYDKFGMTNLPAHFVLKILKKHLNKHDYAISYQYLEKLSKKYAD